MKELSFDDLVVLNLYRLAPYAIITEAQVRYNQVFLSTDISPSNYTEVVYKKEILYIETQLYIELKKGIENKSKEECRKALNDFDKRLDNRVSQ